MPTIGAFESGAFDPGAFDVGLAPHIRAQLRIDLALGGSFRQAVSDDAPRLWYRFADQVGLTTATDASGNRLTATITGGVTLEQPPHVPDGGYAMRFNGTNGYLAVADDALLHIGDIFTIEAWIKYTNLPSTLVSLVESPTANAPSFEIDATGRLTVKPAGGATIVTATVAIADTEWHHVAWTKSGATTKVYLDGVDVTGPVTNATIASTAVGFWIAQNGSGANWFGGDIDELAIYPTALSASRIALHVVSGAWTDVTTDVAGAESLTSHYGISGNGPTDRLSDVGLLTFALKNDATNSGHVAGYYSPRHPNCRAGFTFGVLTRLTFIYASVDYPRFLGKIASITPVPGVKGVRRTHILVHDLMGDLIETALRNVTLQITQTEAQLLRTLITALPITAQPLALNLDAGLDSCPFAFDTLGAGDKAIGPAGDLAISSLGYLHMGPTGVLRYENRQARQLKISTATFSDDMTDLSVPADLAGVFDHVRATFHPKTLDSAATTVLWSQTGAAPSIAAGASITIWGDYFNPTNPMMAIGGTAQVAPVATTDYLANTLADGNGTNKTANVTVAATFFASTVKFVVTNNDAGAVFLTQLQCRGKGTYDLSPVTVESQSQQAYGDRPVDVDLPYQADYNTTQGLADYLRFQYETLSHQIDALAFDAQRSATFMIAALSLEIGDRLTISETQTGLALVDAFVQSVEMTATPGPLVTCRLGLSSTSYFSQVWVMDDPVKSLSDLSTNFGFA